MRNLVALSNDMMGNNDKFRSFLH